jgi:hypothetical protein
LTYATDPSDDKRAKAFDLIFATNGFALERTFGRFDEFLLRFYLLVRSGDRSLKKVFFVRRLLEVLDESWHAHAQAAKCLFAFIAEHTLRYAAYETISRYFTLRAGSLFFDRCGSNNKLPILLSEKMSGECGNAR